MEGYSLQYYVKEGNNHNKKNRPNAAVHRLQQTYKHKHLILSYLVHQAGYASQIGGKLRHLLSTGGYNSHENKTNIT